MADYFYRVHGRIVGPVSGQTLKALCADGQVGRETEIRKGQDGAWVAAGRVAALEAALASTIATAKITPKTSTKATVFKEAVPDWVGVDTVQPKPTQSKVLPGEHVVMKVRPSYLRGYPFKVAQQGGLAIVSIVLLFFSPLAAGCVLVILGAWLTGALLYVLSTELVITDERTSVRRGILSRRTNEIRNRDIRQILVDQSLLQRAFGTGMLRLSSSSQGDVEIEVNGLPRPDRIAQVIRERQVSPKG